MLKDAQRRERPFKHILVYDLKRFGRLDSDEAGYFRHQFRQAGVDIVYVTEGFLGDDTDDILRPIKQFQARQELRDLSKVTTRGLISRADAGWWVGGRPPYGYDIWHQTKAGEFICVVRYMENGTRLVLDAQGEVTRILSKEDSFIFSKSDRSKLVLGSPERVELIERIFKLYTVDGFGFTRICECLNIEGILPPTGGLRKGVKAAKWSSATIASILQNPIYVGDMVWNRLSFGKFHKVSDEHAVPIKREFGNPRDSNIEADWMVTVDAHPAIISRTTFETARKRRENTAKFGIANSHRVGRAATSPYVLTSLIHGTYCGHRFVGQTVHSGRPAFWHLHPSKYFYQCGSYLSKGRSACPRRPIAKDKIETWVLNNIKALLQTYFGTTDGSAKLQQAIRRESADAVNKPAARLKSLSNAIDGIQNRISILIDSLSPTNRDLVDQRLAELQLELSHLKSERAVLLESESTAKSENHLIEESATIAMQFLTCFESASIEEKRIFIRQFVTRIDIDPVSGTGVVHITLLPGMNTDIALPLPKKSALVKKQVLVSVAA